jgi:hypothetical protein
MRRTVHPAHAGCDSAGYGKQKKNASEEIHRVYREEVPSLSQNAIFAKSKKASAVADALLS